MHVPVLLKEVIDYLNPEVNKNFIDATAGEGGHGLAILKKNGPNGRLLGIEIDSSVYENLKKNMAEMVERVALVNDSYINLEKIVKKHNFKPVHGILFDLGMCSWHLDVSGKGFSYLKDEPLDMRFDSERIRRRKICVSYFFSN